MIRVGSGAEYRVVKEDLLSFMKKFGLPSDHIIDEERIDPSFVEGYCRKFTEKTKIKVSEEAMNLIALSVNSIVIDPHPDWNITDEDKLIDLVKENMKSIPHYLEKLANGKKIVIITAYDILDGFGWFSELSHVLTKTKASKK